LETGCLHDTRSRIQHYAAVMVHISVGTSLKNMRDLFDDTKDRMCGRPPLSVSLSLFFLVHLCFVWSSLSVANSTAPGLFRFGLASSLSHTIHWSPKPWRVTFRDGAHPHNRCRRLDHRVSIRVSVPGSPGRACGRGM
jgi:hypothetical protein